MFRLENSTALSAAILLGIGALAVPARHVQGEVVRVYWTDFYNEGVWRANVDGTGREQIVSATMNSLDGLAIDPVESRLYVGTSYDLLRCNLDGSELEAIVHGGDAFDVYGVTVDPNTRRVYWSTWDTPRGIRGANLDGSSLETIFTGTTSYHMDIDPLQESLYWTTSNAIYRADLDGANAEQILINSFGMGHFAGMALDVADNRMYFSTWENGGIWRANMDGSNAELISDDKTAALALETEEGKLYWTSWALGLRDIRRSNLDGSGAESLFLIDGGSNALALEVPEPATLALLALGSLAVLRRRRPAPH